MNTTAESYKSRRLVYSLLITVAVAGVCGRILSVARLYEPDLGGWPTAKPEAMPTMGDNDRSRWDTVRALVDDGTYVIGHRDRQVLLTSMLGSLSGTSPLETTVLSAAGLDARSRSDRGIVSKDGWKTIDKVLRPDTQNFYSSKPPLLPTLAAGEYWVLNKVLGWSIVQQRWEVVRAILITFNGLPFIFYLLFLSRLLERFGTSDWGRYYVLAAAAFGTLLTPFAITFNNHSIAAYTAIFALYPAVRIWYEKNLNPFLFFFSGFFAALTACMDLPAASFCALIFLFVVWRSPAKAFIYFLAGAAIPVAAFLLTNYLAIGKLTVAYDEFGGPWYEYEGSFWRLDTNLPKKGIDWIYQTESRSVYALHVLVGHHGLFLLTPILFFSIAGMMMWGIRRPLQQSSEEKGPRSMIAPLTFMLTAILLAYYIVHIPDRNRNYGGWTAGLRWLMWLTPFWLLSMVPTVDWLSRRRWGRGLGYLFLAISVFSASYAAWTPWRHPWAYNLMEWLEWVKYG